jgi:Transposase zinc-ribbon domain
MRMSDEEAHAKLVEIRWSDNGGQPYCPRCGCLDVYGFHCRPIWRCKGCGKQFSVTSNTIFHSRKLPPRDYLAAIAIFVNGAKGHQRPTTQPGSQLPIQNGVRSRAQIERKYGPRGL